MPVNLYQVKWDPSGMKWEISEDGGAYADLSQNVKLEAGAEGTPSLAFGADTNTGLYSPGADRIILVTAGADRWEVALAGHLLASDDDTYHIGASGANRPHDIFMGGSLTLPNTENILGMRDMYGGCLLDANGLSAVTARVGEFQWDGTVLKAYARRIGGTGATVNAQVGGSDIRSSDLSLTGTAWTDFSTLQNAGITDGEDLDLQIATVTGTVTQIAIILEVERA